MTTRIIAGFQGVTVILTGADGGSPQEDPHFVGLLESNVAAKSGMFVWQAFPKPEGYYVRYSRPGGSTIGSWTGPTLNLGLEVQQGFVRMIK